MVYVRLFDPENWALGERREVVVNKMMTMNEMAGVIKMKFPEWEVREEEMEITKVVALHKFRVEDLGEMEYWNLKGIEVLVSVDPLYIVNDGGIFVVRDRRKKVGVMAQEIGGGSVGESSKGKVVRAQEKRAAKRVPEKGVKITVKKMEKKVEQDNNNNIKGIVSEDPTGTPTPEITPGTHPDPPTHENPPSLLPQLKVEQTPQEPQNEQGNSDHQQEEFTATKIEQPKEEAKLELELGETTDNQDSLESSS